MRFIKLKSQSIGQNWQDFTSVQLHQRWQDILIVLFLLLLGGLASYMGSQLIPNLILKNSLDGVWFGSDIPRVFENMISPAGIRAQVHPLFSLIVYPPVYVLRKVLGVSPIESVRMAIAVVASLWLATLFVLLRLMDCRRLDATLFSLLGATSASSIFWFVVPETYSFGSLSILLAFCFVTLNQYQYFSHLWYVAVIILTLSFTITNGILGFLATLVNHPWRQSLLIGIRAFFVVAVLWKIQSLIFWIPTSPLTEETKWLYFPKTIADLIKITKSFISLPTVMPAIYAEERLWVPLPYRQEMPYSITFSSSAPYTVSPENFWGAIAVGLWLTLLSLGFWGFFSVKKHYKLRLVSGFFLLGQLLLHTVYGPGEIFIYSLHFAPLLVVVAAFSTFTRARPLVLILVSLLAISAGVNNTWHLYQARNFISNFY